MFAAPKGFIYLNDLVKCKVPDNDEFLFSFIVPDHELICWAGDHEWDFDDFD